MRPGRRLEQQSGPAVVDDVGDPADPVAATAATGGRCLISTVGRFAGARQTVISAARCRCRVCRAHTGRNVPNRSALLRPLCAQLGVEPTADQREDGSRQRILGTARPGVDGHRMPLADGTPPAGRQEAETLIERGPVDRLPRAKLVTSILPAAPSSWQASGAVGTAYGTIPRRTRDEQARSAA